MLTGKGQSYLVHIITVKPPMKDPPVNDFPRRRQPL